jgi:hypothetical protein
MHSFIDGKYWFDSNMVHLIFNQQLVVPAMGCYFFQAVSKRAQVLGVVLPMNVYCKISGI